MTESTREGERGRGAEGEGEREKESQYEGVRTLQGDEGERE